MMDGITNYTKDETKNDVTITTSDSSSTTTNNNSSSNNTTTTTTATPQDTTDTTNNNNNHNNRPPNRFLTASFLSRLFFLWPYDLIQRGLEHPPITELDLPDVVPQDSSQYNLTVIEQLWEKEQKRRRGRPNLHRALLQHYISTMWDTQILTGIVCSAQIGQALALGYFIQSFSTTSTSSSSSTSNSYYSGYIYATILVSFGAIVLLACHTLYFKTWHKGMQYRISAVAILYAKSLRLPSVVTSTTNLIPSGKVVNLATNDVERFLLACIMISYLWWGPLQALAVLWVGLYIIGPAFLAGYLLLLIIVALQFVLGKSFAYYRSKVGTVWKVPNFFYYEYAP